MWRAFRALYAGIMAAGGRRERLGDIAWVLVAAAGGLVLVSTNAGTNDPGWLRADTGLAFGVDAAIGVLASGLLWFRRRWPVGVAVALIIPAALSRSAQAPVVLSVCNVALRRNPRTAIAIAVLHQLAFIAFALLWITKYPLWAASCLMLTYQILAVALGLYQRARRQLVDSLTERAERAEATQRLLAEQARQAERARIANEMHDVLAHRVSLIALHAGALEIRPDLPAGQVREAAGLIRAAARQALTELRDVVGVLRDRETAPGAGETVPRAPLPTLSDIEPLVAEYQEAGLNVRLDMRVESPDGAPGPLGRDTYRIVREALANVSKHAAGTAAVVRLDGRPGAGLRVVVRNKLPVAYPSELPGSGLGLVGLAERVELAGGTLSHGPDPAGDFVLTAALRWESD
jgi:signal transduction histidine kinase